MLKTHLLRANGLHLTPVAISIAIVQHEISSNPSASPSGFSRSFVRGNFPSCPVPTDLDRSGSSASAPTVHQTLGGGSPSPARSEAYTLSQAGWFVEAATNSLAPWLATSLAVLRAVHAAPAKRCESGAAKSSLIVYALAWTRTTVRHRKAKPGHAAADRRHYPSICQGTSFVGDSIDLRRSGRNDCQPVGRKKDYCVRWAKRRRHLTVDEPATCLASLK